MHATLKKSVILVFVLLLNDQTKNYSSGLNFGSLSSVESLYIYFYLQNRSPVLTCYFDYGRAECLGLWQ